MYHFYLLGTVEFFFYQDKNDINVRSRLNHIHGAVEFVRIRAL